MALPSTNITTTLVRNTTGVPSNALTEMIGFAKTGGSGGRAFDTYGYQIAGAEPYWNKWAANIPGQWDYSRVDPVNTELGLMELRIKRNPPIPTGFSNFLYQLGDYRLYNHDAPAPMHTIPSTRTVASGRVQIGGGYNFYEWALPFDVTHVKTVFNIGGVEQSLLSEIGQLSLDTVVFTGVAAGTNTGTAKIYASNSLGTLLSDITGLIADMQGNYSNPYVFQLDSVSSYVTFSRMMAVPYIDDYTVVSGIVEGIPTNQQVAPGAVDVNVNIGYSGSSTTYSGMTFDLVLRHNYDGGYQEYACGSVTITFGQPVMYQNAYTALARTTVNGDSLGFHASNIVVY